MTKLEQLVKYAKNLPVDTQNTLANDLFELMKNRSKGIRLTADEIADVKQALSNPNPSYASEAEVLAALGANFS
ncbi:MAG: hypothetical protein COA91_07120 [Robiginitomaculum sp.]|nr:MAG: hypothetical protein COA91_07120 [Robiginitomaculum sp.]